MRDKVILPVILAILILGSFGMIQHSYALTFDLNPPDYAVPSDDCHIGVQYIPPVGTGMIVRGGNNGPGCTLSTAGNNFIRCVGTPTAGEVSTSSLIGGATCDVETLNYIDQFETKLIRLQVGYSGPTTPTIGAIIPSEGSCIFGERFDSQGYFFQDFICHPNPEFEEIQINVASGTDLLEVIVDTVSFGSTAVGGEFIGIDTTSVLAAGAQYNAAWMIPVIVSAIGIGIVIARKF